MIISMKYAQTLIRQGKAKSIGLIAEPYIIGRRYMALDRFDKQRTDHYEIPAGK